MVDVEIVGGEQELLPDRMTALERAGCVIWLKRRHSDDSRDLSVYSGV